MEEFLDDLGDFICDRLAKAHINIENTKSFKQKYEEYTTLCEKLTKFLENNHNENLQTFKNILVVINELNDFYDKSTYKRGFVDGINMIYSTNSKYINNDLKME